VQAELRIVEGSALRKNEQLKEALAVLTATRRTLKDLPEKVQAEPRFRFSDADASIELARVHLAGCNFPEASTLMGESTQVLDALAGENSDDALFRHKVAEAWYVRALVAGAMLAANDSPLPSQRLADDAISSLRKAKALGFFADPSNVEGMKTDASFTSFHDDERFAELLRNESSPVHDTQSDDR
jgi:hypothetical protein